MPHYTLELREALREETERCAEMEEKYEEHCDMGYLKRLIRLFRDEEEEALEARNEFGAQVQNGLDSLTKVRTMQEGQRTESTLRGDDGAKGDQVRGSSAPVSAIKESKAELKPPLPLGRAVNLDTERNKGLTGA